jgi:hypothetical protein
MFTNVDEITRMGEDRSDEFVKTFLEEKGHTLDEQQLAAFEALKPVLKGTWLDGFLEGAIVVMQDTIKFHNSEGGER